MLKQIHEAPRQRERVSYYLFATCQCNTPPKVRSNIQPYKKGVARTQNVYRTYFTNPYIMHVPANNGGRPSTP